MFNLSDIAVGTPTKVMSGLPPKGNWFRVHPEYCFPNAKVLYVPGNTAGWYLLGNKLGDCAGNYLANLHLGIDAFGQLWILVATQANPDNEAAMEQGKTTWIRRVAVNGTVYEDSQEMSSKNPAWPDNIDFNALLNAAFPEEKFIDDLNHRLLKPRKNIENSSGTLEGSNVNISLF